VCTTDKQCGTEGCSPDGKITADVQARLDKLTDLGPPHSIEVQTRDRIVYLNGTVDTGLEKRMAESVAMQCEQASGLDACRCRKLLILCARGLTTMVNVRRLFTTETVTYFRALAKETAIPYQTLMNLYLRDCAQARRRLRFAWPAQRTSRAKVAAVG
jgi:hypothetical protein